MSDRHRRYNPSSGYGIGRYQKSSTTAVSALDRLRSNLSPVRSYYKPLMRTFGKRGGEEDVSNHTISKRKLFKIIFGKALS